MRQIVKYVRDEDFNLIGCVVAISKDKIGYSMCDPHDQFNKKIARTIAVNRAKSGKNFAQSLDEKAYVCAMRKYGFSTIVEKNYAMPRLYGLLYPELLIVKELAEKRGDEWFNADN